MRVVRVVSKSDKNIADLSDSDNFLRNDRKSILKIQFDPLDFHEKSEFHVRTKSSNIYILRNSTNERENHTWWNETLNIYFPIHFSFSSLCIGIFPITCLPFVNQQFPFFPSPSTDSNYRIIFPSVILYESFSMLSFN